MNTDPHNNTIKESILSFIQKYFPDEWHAVQTCVIERAKLGRDNNRELSELNRQIAPLDAALDELLEKEPLDENAANKILSELHPLTKKQTRVYEKENAYLRLIGKEFEREIELIKQVSKSDDLSDWLSKFISEHPDIKAEKFLQNISAVIIDELSSLGNAIEPKPDISTLPKGISDRWTAMIEKQRSSPTISQHQ